MQSIYVLITRTNTLLSRSIRLATGAEYTHVSLALDRGLTRMYSFARRFDRIPFLQALCMNLWTKACTAAMAARLPRYTNFR